MLQASLIMRMPLSCPECNMNIMCCHRLTLRPSSPRRAYTRATNVAQSGDSISSVVCCLEPVFYARSRAWTNYSEKSITGE